MRKLGLVLIFLSLSEEPTGAQTQARQSVSAAYFFHTHSLSLSFPHFLSLIFLCFQSSLAQILNLELFRLEHRKHQNSRIDFAAIEMGFSLLSTANPCILFLFLLSCTCFTSTGSLPKSSYSHWFCVFV